MEENGRIPERIGQRVPHSLRFPARGVARSRRQTIAGTVAVLAAVAVAGVALAAPLAFAPPRSTHAPATPIAAAGGTADGSASYAPTADATDAFSGSTPEPDPSMSAAGDTAQPSEGPGGGGGWWQSISWDLEPVRVGVPVAMVIKGLPAGGWCRMWLINPRMGSSGAGLLAAGATELPDANGNYPILGLDLSDDNTGPLDGQLSCWARTPSVYGWAGGHLWHIAIAPKQRGGLTVWFSPGTGSGGNGWGYSTNFRVDDPTAAWGSCDFHLTPPGGKAVYIARLGGGEHTWVKQQNTEYLNFYIMPMAADTPSGLASWSATCTDSNGLSETRSGQFVVWAITTTPPPATQPPATHTPATTPPTEPPAPSDPAPSDPPTPTEPPAEPSADPSV